MAADAAALAPSARRVRQTGHRDEQHVARGAAGREKRVQGRAIDARQRGGIARRTGRRALRQPRD